MSFLLVPQKVYHIQLTCFLDIHQCNYAVFQQPNCRLNLSMETAFNLLYQSRAPRAFHHKVLPLQLDCFIKPMLDYLQFSYLVHLGFLVRFFSGLWVFFSSSLIH